MVIDFMHPIGRLALIGILVLGSGACGDGVILPDPKGDIGVETDAIPWWEQDVDASDPDADDAQDIDETSVTPDADVGETNDTAVGPKPGEFLHECDGNQDCFSSYCVESTVGDVCTQTCDDNEDCPTGWGCKSVSSGGDPVFICVPTDLDLCRPCEVDGDCDSNGTGNGVCISVGDDGRACTRGCNVNLVCPTGFSCENIAKNEGEAPKDLCVPDEADACQCTPKFVAENAKSVCAISNEFGSCPGAIACVEVGPFPGCLAETPAQEICNGLDDDCDGKTDEEALDCVRWFADPDGDGWGQGLGACICTEPELGWVDKGGDCNELVTNINPGVVEACNGLDDNCDGSTDEAGSFGCKAHYLDADNDLYGSDAEESCLCTGTDGWSPDGGDCDDDNKLMNPGALEYCDGLDNDCDGGTDEVGAEDCNVFFLDQDGDGFGLSDKVKCLCGPTGVYKTSKPNDCDDTNVTINPNAVELCNGEDDNCNKVTDEGEPASMCPQVANGIAGCVEGTCDLLDCDTGWNDADGDPLNGCECPEGAAGAGGLGKLCQEPQSLGSVADNGSEILIADNIVPIDDADWYQVNAVDLPDTGGCDTFKLRIEFLHNPAAQFTFDVYKGGCGASKQICGGSTVYTEETSFFSAGGAGGPTGECPCAVDSELTAPGVNLCTDQTESYWIRVYRKPGKPMTCAAYTLRITNG